MPSRAIRKPPHSTANSHGKSVGSRDRLIHETHLLELGVPGAQVGDLIRGRAPPEPLVDPRGDLLGRGLFHVLERALDPSHEGLSSHSDRPVSCVPFIRAHLAQSLKVFDVWLLFVHLQVLPEEKLV